MGKSARVTVVRSDELSDALEQARERSGQSRSAYIRDVVARVVNRGHDQAAIDRYVQGYRTMPESAEEAWEFAPLPQNRGENSRS